MNKNVVNSSVLPDWAKDKPLFKYLKKEYADKLFRFGEVLIGTLYDFRNQEQYGVKRGDSGEGKKEIFEKIDDLTVKDPSKNNPLSPFVKQFVKLEDTAKNTQFMNCEFSQSHESKDCYIYCMSKEFDEIMYDEFKADICIKIKSPYGFIRAISVTLKHKAKFNKISPVQYCNRSQLYGEHDEYHASIIKSRDYKNQKEIRALWESTVIGDIKPLLINLKTKHIVRFCEIHNEK